MNRRCFFTTLAALLLGTTTQPRRRYATASNAYVPRRARPGELVIAFSRDPRQFPMRRYVKYQPKQSQTWEEFYAELKQDGDGCICYKKLKC